MFLFASMIRLQEEEAPPGTIRVPGGRPVAVLLACLGFATAALATVLSLIPPPEEANRILFSVKILGSSVGLVLLGLLLFHLGQRRQSATR
jgi:hypothetical protein